jgi:hypothetical protein
MAGHAEAPSQIVAVAAVVVSVMVAVIRMVGRVGK